MCKKVSNVGLSEQHFSKWHAFVTDSKLMTALSFATNSKASSGTTSNSGAGGGAAGSTEAMLELKEAM